MQNIVINLNKPSDMSSQQAVTKIKKLFSAKKAGHAGTLDPIATGVLLICLNQATKVARFLSDLEKEYIVKMKFGQRTDTFDSTGKVIEEKNADFLTETMILNAIEKFTGAIKQKPPVYSAIKVNGQRLYKLARKGINIDVAEREVYIRKIQAMAFIPPFFKFKVTCSKGTYIRSLCDDIGIYLGTFGHMVSLTRSRIGNFNIQNAFSFEDSEDKLIKAIYSIDSAISHLNELILEAEDFRKLKNGYPYEIPNKIRHFQTKYIRLKTPENSLLGIGKLENNHVRIERLLN